MTFRLTPGRVNATARENVAEASTRRPCLNSASIDRIRVPLTRLVRMAWLMIADALSQRGVHERLHQLSSGDCDGRDGRDGWYK